MDSAMLTVPELAFVLLGVVLTTINGFEAMQERFGWPSNPRLDGKLQTAKIAMTDTWAAAARSGV